MHTLVLSAGQRTVTIRSNTSSVTDWAARYFSPYWSAMPVADTYGPVVTVIDGDRGVTAPVSHSNQTTFARERIGYTHHPDGTVTAHTLSDPVLAYRYAPAERHLEISCRQDVTTSARPGQPTRLATAATRFAREMMRAQLIADGWGLLHASAVTFPGGNALLALGDSGAGKTTTALTLAANGAALLANDCCFARPNSDSTLSLLPWPAAAAIGLGLLKALSFTTPVGSRLRSGELPHPTQDRRVTEALITGRTMPLISESGRELKAHIWPEQLKRWLGLSLATTGIVDTILLPHVTPSISAPARIDDTRSSHVTTDALVISSTERYPDLFGFFDGSNSGTPSASIAILEHLNRLPRYAIDLSHDHKVNAKLLARLSASLIETRLRAAGPEIPSLKRQRVASRRIGVHENLAPSHGSGAAPCGGAPLSGDTPGAGRHD